MNVRINLLPHRELRRERRKKDFVALVALTTICAAAAAYAGGFAIERQTDAQRARNAVILAENQKLDEQIKEIAALRAEIEALRARQEAVETLQSNRTIPVHLMDELVEQIPEGLLLKSVKQDERRVTLSGLAQSNERISDLLRNLAKDSPWLERPELVEIKAVTLGGGAQAARAGAPKGGAHEAAEPRRVYEFALNALVRPGGDPAAGTVTGVAGAGQAGASATVAQTAVPGAVVPNPVDPSAAPGVAPRPGAVAPVARK